MHSFNNNTNLGPLQYSHHRDIKEWRNILNTTQTFEEKQGQVACDPLPPQPHSHGSLPPVEPSEQQKRHLGGETGTGTSPPSTYSPHEGPRHMFFCLVY